MNTLTLYVIDTTCIISYFCEIFCQESKISTQARKIIQNALCQQEGEIKISIPSIVFVELFEKWLRNEEFAKKFFYEVYIAITQSPNIEIKSLDQEVVLALLEIDGILLNHDIHDKIVLASAISLGCKLITTDNKIIDYIEKTKIIPGVIN